MALQQWMGILPRWNYRPILNYFDHIDADGKGVRFEFKYPFCRPPKRHLHVLFKKSSGLLIRRLGKGDSCSMSPFWALLPMLCDRATKRFVLTWATLLFKISKNAYISLSSLFSKNHLILS